MAGVGAISDGIWREAAPRPDESKLRTPAQETHVSRYLVLVTLAAAASWPALAAPSQHAPAVRAKIAPSPEPAGSVRDPFESLNRRSFRLSIGLDTALVGPIARVSVSLIPAPLEKAIHNIIVNLSEPQVILNCFLQGRPQGVVKAVTRLAVNSTIGLAGAVDVARAAGLPYEPNGFGDTLGRYHIGPGPYIFIPLLGPSNFRDLAGAVVDQVSTPLFFVRYPYRTPVEVTLGTVFGLEERAEDGPKLQALLDSSADPYATIRSAYSQSRDAQIRGSVALPVLPDMDDGDEAPATAQDPATPGAAQATALPAPSGGSPSIASPPARASEPTDPGTSPAADAEGRARPPSPATPPRPESPPPGPGPA